jgi:glycosyltransferase involved in cell wall biosynthesis
MKILFVVSSLTNGGQERQLSELAPGLARQGHHVDVAVPYHGDHYEQYLVESGVRVVVLRKRSRSPHHPTLRFRIVEMVLRLMALRKLIRVEKYDVVHGFGDISNVYVSLASGLRRSHAVVWGIRASENLGNVVAAGIAPILSRKVDLVICNSRAGAKLVEASGWRPGVVEVIPNGIDIQRCNIDEKARYEVRQRLGVRCDEKLVGIIGNFHPRKGHRVFIEAASQVDPTLNCKFLMIGGDSLGFWPAYKEHAEELGVGDRLIYGGLVADAERYMNAMDVLVSSSFTEGFSNVLAEGMACGVPCVATDVGDSAMILGSLGEVVPPGDSAAMARAIERIVRGGHAERATIRGSITSHYSIEKLILRTEAALNQAMT